ncbi:MAG TPA: DUF2877 domain-containing protein [Ktedonobacterales bacterium]|nr:DUF2877 domain-containing protein [Ktedonobacterales bacterium]
MVTLLLRVLSHSTAIQPLLDIPTTRGSVQSVFPRAANLLFGSRLLTLHARDTPCAPNGLVLPLRAGQGPLADLQTGMAVIIERGTIYIPTPSLRLSTQNSQPWNPRPHLEPGACPPERLERNLERLTTLMAGKASRDGLAALANLPVDAAGVSASAEAEASADESFLLHTARSAAALLLDGVIHQNHQAMRQGASTLTGLGPGLTPSGDDLLIGFMAATSVLNAPLGLSSDFYQRLHMELLTIARGRTNKLSITWMEYARQGEVAEHLGHLFHALVGDNARLLEDAALTVLKSGATSGGDLLAGIILGSRCLIEQHRLEQARG